MRADRRGLPPSAMVAVGAAIPLIVCVLLSLAREMMANANVVLILVLAVVAAAALGSRAAGLAAAVVSAAGFDIFLTQPYGQLAIHSAADVQTTVLLLAIGIAVSELACWGRRQQARASEQRGYLDGIVQSTAALADSASGDVVVQQVGEQLVDLLDLDEARFVPQLVGQPPVIERDGSLTRSGQPIDADRLGLPTDTEVWLPVGGPPETSGFRLVASTHVARPTRQQRQVAALMSEQVAAVLRQEARQS